MCEVIEFKSRTSSLYNKKYQRKVYLSTKVFNQNITEAEEMELNNLCEWLKIHNN
jgi:hypothetical protein